jgi:hypothetical protein
MTNNKQQTEMKLYTQEQLERAMDLANRNVNKKSIIESLTPIELPSNDEIDEESPYVPDDASIDFWSHKEGFVDGAKWMRNKIQGGEQ